MAYSFLQWKGNEFPLALLVSFKIGQFAVNHTKCSILCVRILALVTRHADYTFLVRRVIVSSVACPTLHYFSALSHKPHDLRKTIFEQKYVLISLRLPFRTFVILRRIQRDIINRLTPNDPYMGRTAPLTSKRCILYIYSTNLGTGYFKHALYSPFFSSSKCSLCHNANLFGSYIIHILYTGCAKIKKKLIQAPKG